MSLEFEHIDIPFQYVVWRTMTRLEYQHKYGPGTTQRSISSKKGNRLNQYQ